jgi:AraC family transcriptional regulator, transcriptional activator of pobA
MEKSRLSIPFYTEINDFLASIPWSGKTNNPDFYCLRLKKIDEVLRVYRPPFKRSFYFFALFRNTGQIEVNYDDKRINNPDSYMVFHAPNLIYSFSHNNELEGYIVYFKAECFSFFKQDFHRTFPLFDLLHTNLFKFDHATYDRLAPHFEAVFQAYDNSVKDQHMEARLKLLGLLYFLEDFSVERKKESGLATPQQILLKKFIQLVNNHYFDIRTVREYAEMLSVTANYLSQSVKQVSGKNALAFISERLAGEAKSLILYTDSGIAEIAYQLNFSDPANFGKFFRGQTGESPSDYRKKHK